jgi:hypothetical protein
MTPRDLERAASFFRRGRHTRRAIGIALVIVGATFGIAEAPSPPYGFRLIDSRTPIEKRADFCIAAFFAGLRCL